MCGKLSKCLQAEDASIVLSSGFGKVVESRLSDRRAFLLTPHFAARRAALVSS
jgi:hypothetical protein